MALGRDHGLLLGTGVQLVVFYTTIEVQVVFETLLALVTGQLAITGQLGREVHPRSVRFNNAEERGRKIESKLK